MSRSSRGGQGRLAVVGATTDEGARLREALAEYGVEGSRVDLYGTIGGEVVLSEYDGEARMIQQPDAEEIAAHDVIFLCERGRLALAVAAAAGRAGLLVDLVDSLPSGSKALYGAGKSPGADAPVSPVVAVPHPIALVLAELLIPLEQRVGLVEVTVVGLRPASDFGKAGVEELREQTVQLLRFAAPPTETFGRQLAFNLLPTAAVAAREPGLEDRIGAEVGSLLGWPHGRIALRLVVAPLFHGHAFELRVRTAGTPALSEIREALSAAGLLGADADAPLTPFEIAGRLGLSVGDLAADGPGAFWLSAVAGETASRGARRAIEIAVRTGRLELPA